MEVRSDLTFESEGVVSFTDETTPRGLSSRGERVIIAAQFDVVDDIGWYYELVKHIAVDGELKSAVVINRLRDIPAQLRACAWKGAKTARIHITDCRPYALGLQENWLSSGNEYLLRADVRMHPEAGNRIRREMDEFIAGLVLLDSPAERLDRYIRRIGLNGPLDLYDEDDPERTHDRLHSSLKGSLKNALLLAVRSAAAFGSALDARSSMTETDDLWSYLWAERRRLAEELSKSHAFDRGNELVVATLESLRADFHQQLNKYVVERPNTAPKLISIDSLASDFVRAADIAAGLAAETLRTDSLLEVVRRFHHVTYNGDRVDEELAIKEMKRMQGQLKSLQRLAPLE